MAVHIPPILVLFVCKVAVAGAPDMNADFTGAQNLEWATVNSMMTCRRQELPLYDPSEAAGAAPLDPNLADWAQCAHAAAGIGSMWDVQHAKEPWRVWRIGCPAPIVDSQTGVLIGYKLPECPHREYAVCETDSAI